MTKGWLRETIRTKWSNRRRHTHTLVNESTTPTKSENTEGNKTPFNETEPPGQIRILQWNVLHDSTPEQIAATIKEIEEKHGSIHVVCAQEIPIKILEKGRSGEQAEEIAKSLGMPYVHFAPQYLQKHKRFKPGGKTEKRSGGAAIFSKYPFASDSEEIHQLSERKGKIDFYKHNHGFSLLLSAGIQIPGRDEPLKIGDFHLSISTEMPWMRAVETYRLKKQLKKLDMAFGDANSDPRSPLARTIFRTLPRCDDGTLQPTFDKKFGPLRVTRRLDYGLAQPETKVIKAEILDIKGSSDHYPILYTINTN